LAQVFWSALLRCCQSGRLSYGEKSSRSDITVSSLVVRLEKRGITTSSVLFPRNVQVHPAQFLSCCIIVSNTYPLQGVSRFPDLPKIKITKLAMDFYYLAVAIFEASSGINCVSSIRKSNLILALTRDRYAFTSSTAISSAALLDCPSVDHPPVRENKPPTTTFFF